MPDERSAKAAILPTCGSRPLRWPATTAIMAALITSAPAVAAMASPIAAPSAGADFAMYSSPITSVPASSC
jgi:hypothetical protein